MKLAMMALAFALHATPASAESLQDYAKECDAAIGVTVPAFVCDDGTLVPETHPNAATESCDAPNQLNEVCDPGSRFTVLTNDAKAIVVAHCRKEHLPDGRYGDIAVIQYSRTSGATCFYQALGNLDGNVRPPSEGSAAWPWMEPPATAEIGCARCHDNGPIVRSPYLAQLSSGPNALPGATDNSFNFDQPYYFVGKDFASWKVYSVEVEGAICNDCHRMGVSNLTKIDGTSLKLGLRATAKESDSEKLKHKNLPYSEDSPIWMPPHQTYYDSSNEADAVKIHDCALRLSESPLPSDEKCTITEYTGSPPPPPWVKYVARLKWYQWPVPDPPPCLSCPEPWRIPIEDGFERVVFAATPSLPDGALLGAGHASEVSFSVQDGVAVGAPFDAGSGQYLQLVDFPANSSPKVTFSAGGVTSEVLQSADVKDSSSTLTVVLGALLALATVVIGVLTVRLRRAQAVLKQA